MSYFDDRYFQLADLEILRKNTLENNLLWLKSFGCNVYRYPDSIYIEHREIPEYCVWLVLNDPGAFVDSTHYARQPKPPKINPEIYVDELCHDEATSTLMANHGLTLSMVNMTIVTALPKSAPFTEVLLVPATNASFEQWLTLYSEGFRRTGQEIDIDRRRWRRAFSESSNIKFWFFAKANDMIGVCQTSNGEGIVGVYSVALRPDLQGGHCIRAAMHAVRSKLLGDGATCFYFERLLPPKCRKRSSVKRPASRTKEVRRLIGYHHSKA